MCEAQTSDDRHLYDADKEDTVVLVPEEFIISEPIITVIPEEEISLPKSNDEPSFA